MPMYPVLFGTVDERVKQIELEAQMGRITAAEAVELMAPLVRERGVELIDQVEDLVQKYAEDGWDVEDLLGVIFHIGTVLEYTDGPEAVAEVTREMVRDCGSHPADEDDPKTTGDKKDAEETRYRRQVESELARIRKQPPKNATYKKKPK
ncbi:hypothetical protein GobsT_30840 [Gemmata obscuriglobus]|uniref:Uncharacterized protein n=1 Tax=Gemmata obscuriglobus TaxID=114 RepID=A0A2Z3HAR9_9BACT|nr:hypothetical protein [Gemmata obscuriglobus]AWM38724.1 hypothetical protein C1280_18160 [Gemmata obscuriglobus]QEG28307.1 hypothetical protein GobsT_30840 [Gemmata obscuriglobus]VTS06149.1 unnamed protein product [Gemmata obscuriglobus UQM 2246]